MAGGLSDDQVASELTKMVEFIKKEAEEKAKEIRIKAGEEYEIEKADIVRSEIATIDQLYEQRYKQAKMSEQITKSTTANKIRLKVLSAKEDILQSVFERAEDELKKIPKNKKNYGKLLVKLIREGTDELNESNIVVRVRKTDLETARKAAETVSETAKTRSGATVNVTVDEKHTLSDDIAGGVIVYGSGGKISIDNTLEERLRLLSNRSLPRIRLELFGPSATRRYFD